MAAKEETHTDTTPKRLGRYRLLRKIARGGMGEDFAWSDRLRGGQRAA